MSKSLFGFKIDARSIQLNTTIKEDTEDKIKQSNHSYTLLVDAHEAFKNASKLTEDDVTTLTHKNQELSKKLDIL